MDFNIILEKVGDFGLYQKLLCSLLVAPSASLCALVYFAQFFIIMVPNHRCRTSDIDNYSFLHENLTLPFEMRDGKYMPQQCVMYNDSLTLVESGRNHSNINQIPVKCKYGWVYDFRELFPTIASELNWVCENDHWPYWIQTFFYFGTSVGCIVFGHIADRFGRRPSIVLSYLFACVAGIASAFVTSIYGFIILRFIVGACIIPLSEDPYVLSLEYIGVKRRTLAIIIWAAGYITFSALCPWIAYGLRDWRLLCIVTSVPLAIVVLFGMLIPESASWLFTQGRRSEAIQMLKTVSKINGREFPEEFKDYTDMNLYEDKKDSNISILDLFRTARLRRNSLIMAAAWFVVYCCYHTNTQNASNLGTNIYESFTYSALVEIPAQFVILFGIDWLGRRWPMVISSFFAGAAGLFTMCVSDDSSTTFLLLALVQRVTLTIVYNIIIQYSAELLPTVLRGRGLAFLRFMGTLGLYLSPFIVYLALSKPALPLLVSGLMIFGIAFASIFLPETLRHHLPHTIEEGENFGADQHISDCPCLPKK